MNSFTDTVLTLLLGWLRTLLNAARDFVSSDSSTSFFAFFQEHWKLLFLVLCLVGFALDIIVYLVRWRPRPVWSKRRKRARHQPVPLNESYDGGPFDPDEYPTGEYVRGTETTYGDYAAEPTMQYQIQSKQPMQTAPVTIPYTTPYFAPEANAYQEEIPQLYTDDPTLDLNLQSSDARQQQQFAFGMEPSFGSAQSEPSYQYPREHASPYAPPQYAPGVPPEESFAPRQPGLTPDEFGPQGTQSFAQPSPYFRPFSERGNADFAPPRSKGFGAVAKRARNLLNTDEESEAVSYRDFQPTVDVSKAFHSPVYPEKKSEGDA